MNFPDPRPYRPLLFRIDSRTGPDSIFWSRVRATFLPTHRSHCFWACSPDQNLNECWKLPHTDNLRLVVLLPRRLLLAYIPPFVRLSPEEVMVFRDHYWRRSPGLDFAFVRAAKQRLNTTRCVISGRITVLGWNSLFLS